MSSYCDFAPGHPVHGTYHDTEYGVPTADEQVLFERLCLEIFQAGLSWELVLKRREGMNAAIDQFDVDIVAAYGEADRIRLLGDSRIIRNRLKVNAIIHNAQRVKDLRASHGGFAAWIAAHHPLTRKEWTKLFKKTFKFTGGEIVNEFLMSVGYLPGCHGDTCPVGQRLRSVGVPWQSAVSGGFVY